MNVHTETVTDTMLDIACRARTLLNDSWYLAGGTALALQIGHRTSIDLDYFSTQPFDVESLRMSLVNTFKHESISFEYEASQTLWCTIENVKVSFITRREKLLNTPIGIEQCNMASLPDITVMKLLAICGREEYKDYVDLACLSRETDIRSWVGWWGTVYPNQDVTSWLIALAAVDSVPEIPLVMQASYDMPPVALTIRSITRELTDYAQRIEERQM